MRFLLIAATTLACACSANDAESPQQVRAELARLDDRNIVEASGLARSHRFDDFLWTLNDGGSPPILYGLGTDGSRRLAVQLRGAENVDWEDLASFTLHGEQWLVVADIGDNNSRRQFVTLYLAREPASTSASVIDVEREIRLRYPDGPRDSEAIAVDLAEQRILLLSKRDIPAELYAVPLFAHTQDEPVVAELLGSITSIPQPTARDRRRALPLLDWHWQPTAMDISADGTRAALLTYRAIFLYRRTGNESWRTAFERKPRAFSLGSIRLAESVAFGRDGRYIFITTEGQNPPLFRFDTTNGN